MKSTQNLPSKLKELRKKNKYSQEYVAEQLNISRQAISHWENGKSYPDIDNLVLLAELYHTTVDELLGEGIIPDDIVPDNSDPDEIVPDAVVPDDEETVIDDLKEKSSLLEILVLSIILVLSSNLYIIGIPVTLFILIWSVRTKRHSKLVYVLCGVCIIMSLHEIFIFFTYLKTVYGSSFVIPR